MGNNGYIFSIYIKMIIKCLYHIYTRLNSRTSHMHACLRYLCSKLALSSPIFYYCRYFNFEPFKNLSSVIFVLPVLPHFISFKLKINIRSLIQARFKTHFIIYPYNLSKPWWQRDLVWLSGKCTCLVRQKLSPSFRYMK